MGKGTILGLLALIGGLLLVLSQTDRKPPAATAHETALLSGRSLRDAVHVRWQVPDKPAIELARAPDGELALVEPIKDRLSPGYWQQICAAWDSAQLRRTPLLADAEGLAKAGLSTPLLQLTATWEGDAPQSFAVGDKSPLGEGRFLLSHGVIWEGGEGLLSSMAVGLEDLRDRAVFRTEFLNCTQLSVSQVQLGKREVISLQRDGQAWRLQEPIVARADAAAAQQFITAVLSLRVGEFIHGVVRLPEREPDILVRAQGGRGVEEANLWLEQGSVFGVLPGRDVVFVSDNRSYTAAFVNNSEQLRARLLLPMQSVPQEIGEVALDDGAKRVRVQRSSEGGEWQLVEPVTYATHPTPINELLQALNNLQARQFCNDKTAADPVCGLGPGRLQLLCTRLNERQVTTLWLGSEVQVGDEALVYACRAEEPTLVVLVPAPAVAILRRDWTSYCALQVAKVNVPVERLDLVAFDRTHQYQAGERGWSKPGDPAPRPELAGLVDEELRDLRGQRAIDLRQQAFGEPDWRLFLRRQNGDALLELRLWDRGAAAPLVVQRVDEPAVGHELSAFLSKNLRELWQ